jgi:VWFA-related protein
MNRLPISAGAAFQAGAASLALAASSMAQTAPAPQVFSTRTDIVVADVTVIDGKGPVLGLALSDFTLSVNGRVRPIQAVDYVASTAPGPSAASSTGTRAATVEREGRYLLIVADEAHLSFGAGRAVLRSAENLVDRLAPEDRVAVMRVPTGGGVEFTRDHSRAIQGLRSLTGRATRRSGLVATIYPSEAVEQEDGGGPGWDAAVERECGRVTGGPCVDSMHAEASAMLTEMRAATDTTLRALEQLLQKLQSSGVRIDVVLISEGLFFDRSSPSLSTIGALAAAAGVSMNVVRPSRDWYDGSIKATSSNVTEDDRLLRQGLEHLAGELRGGFYTAVGDGSAAFDRISAELAGYYLLAFEPTAEDRTGRERRIKVEVKRRGVTLRSRSTFVIPSAAIPSAARATARQSEPLEGRDTSPAARVVEPTPTLPPLAAVNTVPVRLGTYSMFNADDGRVRVLIAAEAGEPVTDTSNWRVYLLLKDQSGQIVSDSAATVSLTPTRATAPSPALFSTEVELGPGEYSLTLALVGADGRVGMVEQKLAARLRPAAGGFNVSDLVVVSEPEAGSAMRLTPTALVDRDRAVVFLEVGHADQGALREARLTFEVAQSEDGPAIVTTPATSEARANPTQRTFAGSVVLSALPPGDYFVRGALVGPGGARSVFAKAFRLDRGVPAAVVGGRGSRAAGPPLMRATAAVPPFSLQRLLGPTVVRAFVDELEKRHPTPSSAMTAFRAGLSHLEAGRPAQAEALFRQTLRAAPDFVGIAFFLGACHAAAGRDREAIGAWQMSLLSKGGDAVYPAMVDAMLRVGENRKALELLREAPNAWPDAAARARREAIARATTGDDEAALSLLVTQLDDRAKDADLLFLGIQVMYRLYLSRGLGEAERAKFGTWTRQYESLGGAESALVRTWRDHVGR